MLKGTWFLFVLLIVILASSMIFGSYGALEGYANSKPTGANAKKHTKCSGSSCSAWFLIPDYWLFYLNTL